MKKMTSTEIRQMWLDFFASKGHEIVPSANLIPVNDPTLLWINAGVAPLKKYFDGREVPSCRRLVNAQKSIRTNDIENVGKTARHHTFFEMLGFFSIGDYFRDEALEMAFELFTSEKWYGMDLNRLYFTVYKDDFESVKKWKSLGVPEDHIIPLAGNFWEIGEGPCGPDTEMFYDRGVKFDPQNLGLKLLRDDLENDRYIEIGNIVFSQFNSTKGLDRKDYPELPSKNIDTGFGLERIACVMQEVDTNYDTDLFMPIIKETERLTNVKYEGQMAFKVIADHLRSVTFAISDGAILSNEGRGYILRRILRRAVRYGKKLGMNEPFLYKLVSVVVSNMKSFYPYLEDKQEMVEKIVKAEEVKFLQTLESGEKRLLDYIANADELIIKKEVAFLLYDTFGFPIELTEEVAEENGFTVDHEGFIEELENQRQRARKARVVDQSMSQQNEDILSFVTPTKFIGYEMLSSSSKVIAIFKDGKLVNHASDDLTIVFDQIPFYGESGGQVGDIGKMVFHDSEYQVYNTIRLTNHQQAIQVDLGSDEISIGDTVYLKVDEEYRNAIMRNHSATHLLNEALRKVLGSHVSQQGSLVTNEYLRFDFNNYQSISNDQLILIEKMVNEQIAKGLTVNINDMPLQEAKKLGVQAVFTEKYGDIVRVVDMDFSKELCGGTHVANTKDIQQFAILSLESKGSGIYRIEATTGSNIPNMINKTLEKVDEEYTMLLKMKQDIVLKAKSEHINLMDCRIDSSNEIPSYQMIINRRQELQQLRELVKDLQKNYTKAIKDKNIISLDEYLDHVEKIGESYVLIKKVENIEVSSLKDLCDRLVNHLGNAIVFIADVCDDKIIFICKNSIKTLNAGNMVKTAALMTGGNGGGRNDFAQAGGKDIQKVDLALINIEKDIKASL